MMTNNYKILFSLSVSHSYFGKALHSYIQLLPGNTTKTLQKRFGIKMRKSINGLEIYSSSAGSIAAFLTYVTTVTGKDYFDFDMLTHPELFWSVTRLPENRLAQLTYDSKLSTQQENEATFILEHT